MFKMSKFTLVAAIILGAASTMDAQVTNRALSFTANGTVDCGVMPALDDLQSYSLQFWINPSEWTKDASIVSRGDSFSAKLGANGQIVFTVGNNQLTASSDALKAGDWNQLTLICDNGTAQALVNGTAAGTAQLGTIPADNDNPLMLGGNYTGMIDEVRVWTDALNDDMKRFDYFVNNTLNKWCPMWSSLAAYYKMDQESCENLVDYKVIDNPLAEYNNHGILSEGVSRVEANNAKMPYLINSAYTNNDRFFDRIIPRDQYLLANDLIILGADVFASDGHIETKTPNNHATDVSGVSYIESFENRDGVAVLNGSSSPAMTLPAATIATGSVQYSLETWMYIDEWVPGAMILQKENADHTQGLAIYFGNDDEKRIIVRINGNTFANLANRVPEKTWFHLAVVPGNGLSVGEMYNFYINGVSRGSATDESSPLTSKVKGVENLYLAAASATYPIYMGQNFKGKLDETCIWNRALALNEVQSTMTYIPLPALNRNVNVDMMKTVGGYYRFDDQKDLGFSSHSQDGWLKIMKGAYDGHAGVKFYLSIQGYYTPRDPYGNWRNILSDKNKRARFVSDLAALSKNYDGVELDLEWQESTQAWNNYFVLCDEIKQGLPEGKIFRVSTHQSYRQYINVEKSKDYDGFTWQQYGPNASLFGYQSFVNCVNNILNGGGAPEKTMTSWSTTTSNGSNGSDVIGVKNGALNNYTPGDQNVDTYTVGSTTWSYMGPMQVYKRAKYTRENNLQGIFYWDMGNDIWNGTVAEPVHHPYNMATWCSYGINANNDTIVNKVDVKHIETSSIGQIVDGKKGSEADITVSPSPAKDVVTVTLANGDTAANIKVFSISGALVAKNNDDSATLNVGGLHSGIYVLTANDAKGDTHKTKFIKN